jgi:hypothetical protein
VELEGTGVKRVLFVGYGGGHVAMLLPVMRALRARWPEVDCRLLALTTGFKTALAAGEQPLGYKDFLHLFDRDAVLAWGERLLEGNTSPDVVREESLAYLGINYLDLVAQHGEQGAQAYHAQHGRFGFHPVHFMRQVLAELRPDMVVATNSPRSEAAVLQAATQLGVPSLGMIDLFALDSDGYLRRPPPQWTCVLAPAVRDRVVAAGFAPERVVVTGNPAFDGLQSASNKSLAQRYVEERGWQHLKPILWAGQTEPPGFSGCDTDRTRFARGVENTLRDFVAAREDLALIVRYHPGEWQLFERHPDAPRVHFSVPLGEPIHPVILAAQAVVVQNSTVGLEAAIAGRPVVSMEASVSVRNSFSLADLRVSTGCETLQQLPALLDRLLQNPSAVSGAYASDGRAAERVVGVIAQALLLSH